MRWLRFAAFGALVPLALFALLASSVAPREVIREAGCIVAPWVSICGGAAESDPLVHAHRITRCGYRPRPRAPSELMRDIEAVSAHFAPPDLPFDAHAFVPVVLRESLFGAVPPARCQPADGRVSPPIWPERATRLGIREGWVLIEFDVSDAGIVENARVIDAAPRNVFEASALRAIGRWCYRPALQDGRAAGRIGRRVKLSFEADGARS